jgi:hypothetical protein
MKKFLTKLEIKWATIFVLVTWMWMFFEKLMGWHEAPGIANHATYTMIFMIPAIGIYVFALREKRVKYYKGRMTWLEGFLSGLGITVLVTLFSPISQYITSEIITPDYFTNVINYVSENEIMTRIDAEAYFNLKNYIQQASVGALVMGIFTAAVVAFIVKSK